MIGHLSELRSQRYPRLRLCFAVNTSYANILRLRSRTREAVALLGPTPPMSQPSGIFLSVVIPAYNEERRLPRTLKEVLQYLERQNYVSEVLVVDDGSRDSTPRLVSEWPNPGVPLRLVSHLDGRNHGKGATVRRGMLEASGRYRLFMDADNSTTVEHVEKLLPFFDQGYDVVIGSRGMKESDIPEPQPWYRRLAGNVGNLIIQALAVPGIQDTQAGFKMLTNACTEDLFPRMTVDRWGFDVELLAVARHLGYRVKEVPIRWVNDPEGTVTASAYLQALGEVWRVRRNIKAGVYESR